MEGKSNGTAIWHKKEVKFMILKNQGCLMCNSWQHCYITWIIKYLFIYKYGNEVDCILWEDMYEFTYVEVPTLIGTVSTCIL